MFRTASMAALALAFLSSAAFAKGAPSNGPPAQLSGGPGYDDRDAPPGYDDRDAPPQSDYDDRDAPPPAAQAQNAGPQDSSRDVYCRRSAAAETGYYTPGEAARDERASSAIGGTLAGAALGAIIGAGSHAAGPGALIGAGAGLIAGTAIGSGNAHRAAADVEAAYSDAYYACMADNGAEPRPSRYAYGPAYGPPPPAYYAPYPYASPYPYYYGPAVRFDFGFGGGRGWRGRGRR